MQIIVPIVLSFLVFLYFVIFIVPIIIKRRKDSDNKAKKKLSVGESILINSIPPLLLAIFVASLQIWQSQQISENQIEHTEMINKKQTELTEEIRKENEYRTSIDFLSSSSPSVRILGVENLLEFAMEAKVNLQTANNNEDEDTIREKSNKQIREIWKILNDHVRYFTQTTTYKSDFSNPEDFTNKPSGDIQRIANIQTFRDREISNPFYNCNECIVDWRGAYLHNIDLRDAKLQGARLDSAKMHHADLNYADIHGAILIETQLIDAELESTEFQGSCLYKVDFTDAKFDNTDLRGVYTEEYRVYMNNGILTDNWNKDNFIRILEEQANKDADYSTIIISKDGQERKYQNPQLSIVSHQDKEMNKQLIASLHIDTGSFNNSEINNWVMRK